MARKKQITLVSKKTIVQVANIYKLEAGKRYIINVPDIDLDDVEALKSEFEKRGISDVIIVVAPSMLMAEFPVDAPIAKPVQ